MNKSYRLKLEQALSEQRINQRLLIDCCAKFTRKAKKLAARVRSSRALVMIIDENMDDWNSQLQQLIEYRKPFLAALHTRYGLTLDQIKAEIADTLHDEKKCADIPSYGVINDVREMITSGRCVFEDCSR